jgi:hypothetical protein
MRRQDGTLAEIAPGFGEPGDARTGAELPRQTADTEIEVVIVPAKQLEAPSPIAWRRAVKLCYVCGTLFCPMQPHHRLCRRCWRWTRIGALIERLNRGFADVRQLPR